MEGLSAAGFAAWVEASCERSGVPVFVTDPQLLAQVGRLVGAGGGAPARRASAEAAPRRPSQPPMDLDPGRIEGSGSHRSRQDRHVVDQCTHDRGLSA